MDQPTAAVEETGAMSQELPITLENNRIRVVGWHPSIST